MRLAVQSGTVAFCLAVGSLGEDGTVTQRTTAAPEVRGWAALADQVRGDAALAAPLAELIEGARKTAAGPIVKRVYRYEDIGRDRTHLDGRARFMDGQPRQSWFGLAMSDCGTANTVASELPRLAFAFRCTGEAVFRDRIIAQLAETVSWEPIQRPGWGLCVPSPDPVPADYNDGSWLATGWGLRGIADTLELLPPDSLPAPLTEAVATLLRREIAGIAADWQAKRQWFVRGNHPNSNQWVLPTEGLIRACLAVGRDACPAEYELGVRNLLTALDIQGPRGEFCEGIGYASMTIDAFLSAAHAMAAAGDRRALEHPFMRGFPTWQVHHLQPGRFVVNAFDGGGNRSTRTDGGWRNRLAQFAALGNDPRARWALQTLWDGPTNDLVGLLARSSTGPSEPMLPYAAYEMATQINWRDSWDDLGTGVWVRGGHRLDSHDHFDRGHVNYIARGRPILIEAGCPSYDNPSIHTLYSTVTGHNVLDLPGLKPKKAPAPITVHRLDAAGGEVTVDATAGYPGLASWTRRVQWQAGRLEVADRVAFAEGQKNTPTFRWHLGTQETAEIKDAGQGQTVRWTDAEVALTGNVPLLVTQEKLPDNTVNLGSKANGWDYQHTAIVVRAATPCASFELATRVTPLVTDPAALPTYAAYCAARPAPPAAGDPPPPAIVLQAEEMIVPDSGTVAVTTKVGAKGAISTWNSYGAELAREIDVPADGWYSVLIRYCADGTPRRSLFVDGVIPFRELALMSFPPTRGPAPSDGWSNTSDDWRIVSVGAGAGGQAHLLRLTRGRHRFALRQEDGITGMNVDWVILLPAGADRDAAVQAATGMP